MGQKEGEVAALAALAAPRYCSWLSRRRTVLFVSCALCLWVVAVREPESLFLSVKVEAIVPAAGSLPPPLPRATRRHFVVATPTADHRHGLVKGMRAWRRGVRTLVLTNASGEVLEREQVEGRRHNEQWLHFPDVPRFSVTNKSGDPRAAMAPVLAAARLGSFKWMLYSDDDVAFLWPGVLRMLEGLSPEDPYLLSDSYWSRWSRKGQQEAREKGEVFEGLRNSQPPKPSQPRCLPCTFDDTDQLDRRRRRRRVQCWPAAPAGRQAVRIMRSGQGGANRRAHHLRRGRLPADDVHVAPGLWLHRSRLPAAPPQHPS